MGLTFRKSISLCKGVKLNLGKKSASISVGRKGIHQSISTTGRTTTSLSIPGTGVGYTKSFNLKKGFKNLFGKDKDKDKKEDKKEDKKGSSKKEVYASGAEAEKKGNKGLSEEQIKENKEIYGSYIEQISLMRSIHKQADEPIDWQEVYDRPEPVSGALAGLRADSKKEHDEWQELHDTAQKVLAGDIDTYLSLVEELEPYADLLEYGSDFEVGTDDPSFLEVEFKVKSEEVVPEREYILDDKGNLKEKDLSKSAYYDMLQDYVCSAILRVARDSFALLPIERVLIHAVDKALNTATGREEENTIVSVCVEREALDQVDFDRLDPSDALNAFGAKMKFKKTSGFEPVPRLD